MKFLLISHPKSITLKDWKLILAKSPASDEHEVCLSLTDAISYLQRDRFDAVIIDMGMSSYSTLKSLKMVNHIRFSQVTVVVTNDLVESISIPVDKQADIVIPRPFKINDALLALRAAKENYVVTSDARRMFLAGDSLSLQSMLHKRLSTKQNRQISGLDKWFLQVTFESLMSQGMKDKCKFLLSGLMMDRNDPTAKILMAKLLIADNRPSEALMLYADEIEGGSMTNAALFVMSQAFMSIGDFSSAKSLTSTIIANGVMESDVFASHAKSLFECGEFKSSVEVELDSMKLRLNCKEDDEDSYKRLIHYGNKYWVSNEAASTTIVSKLANAIGRGFRKHQKTWLKAAFLEYKLKETALRGDIKKLKLHIGSIVNKERLVLLQNRYLMEYILELAGKLNLDSDCLMKLQNVAKMTELSNVKINSDAIKKANESYEKAKELFECGSLSEAEEAGRKAYMLRPNNLESSLLFVNILIEIHVNHGSGRLLSQAFTILESIGHVGDRHPLFSEYTKTKEKIERLTLS
ncbi:hypothetical protein [Vibrio metschnikovii]|uniref:Uncharacterized protein n=1 Tax=Vibrio metschnikovii TaxID=28172 RepID=A0A9X0R8A5_VIBME|nr:hypothetical protein [Vibrio metschnikovii]MBC5851424.1 hypothetical protein [Vibrio metschnikovii]